MGVYGVFAWNENGVETTAIDGRSFYLDMIPVNKNNPNSSKTYPVNTSVYRLVVTVVGAGGMSAGYIRPTVSGATVSWKSIADQPDPAGYIFVSQVEV
ncbi:hypothetical protein TUM12370_24230 [Salmonella enterica subsp. enterica serovar Choleraesuis]|nr:hypothetical protein TUM12370_24230 [Salmonella enterica subsp. enterica serovar Choleraesuis]